MTKSSWRNAVSTLPRKRQLNSVSQCFSTQHLPDLPMECSERIHPTKSKPLTCMGQPRWNSLKISNQSSSVGLKTSVPQPWMQLHQAYLFHLPQGLLLREFSILIIPPVSLFITFIHFCNRKIYVIVCACLMTLHCKLLEDGSWSAFFSFYMEYLLKIWSHVTEFLKKDILLSNEEITVTFIMEVICGLGLQTF